MKKNLHKFFLFSSLFFAAMLFSEKGFAQSAQTQKATQQNETTKSDSAKIKEEKNLLPGLPPGFHKWEGPNKKYVYCEE